MASRGILIDKDGIVIRNGRTAVGNTTKQETNILLRMVQGDSKDDPTLGPNVKRKIRSTSITDLNKAVRIALMKDGKSVNNVVIENGNIKVLLDE